MRISDWSSDVCSSDLAYHGPAGRGDFDLVRRDHDRSGAGCGDLGVSSLRPLRTAVDLTMGARILAKNLSLDVPAFLQRERPSSGWGRSEEHTSELQSLMRNSYAVFCLKKNTIKS